MLKPEALLGIGIWHFLVFAVFHS
uniref:Uncharacterized protein n=1 Tax=Arundo donax TaxID=35708 RepID=A0A0A8YZE0_ARUDO